MRPRFQADADLHADIVTGVLRREPTIDFQTAQERLGEAMTDTEVLALPAAEGRILVSHDVECPLCDPPRPSPAQQSADGPRTVRRSGTALRGCVDHASRDLLGGRRRPTSLSSSAGAWRETQIARCDLQLSQSHNAFTFHGPLVFELSVGCSVGCWFCGAGAEKLSAHFLHTEENARLWRATLEVSEAVLGRSAAREPFCYWATDPLDNPDYERFCDDVVSVLGVFPPTTTALALKNVARTRRLLLESERHAGHCARFSVLTLSMLTACTGSSHPRSSSS